MVARALPGGAGSAARARASAACLAAARAAQGAAPRRPSLRLAGSPPAPPFDEAPSSLMIASDGRVTEASGFFALDASFALLPLTAFLAAEAFAVLLGFF